MNGPELSLDLVHAIAGRLNLTQPLVFLDVETTGVDVEIDRIWELGAVKLRPDLTVTAFHSRFNPGIPVSVDAKAKTGITDEELAGERPFESVSKMLVDSLTDVDLAAYNGRRFDARILVNEFARSGQTWTPGLIVDPYAIWTQREARDLKGALRRFAWAYKDEAGNHDAVGDVLGVVAVLLGQMEAFWPGTPGDEPRRFTVQDLVTAGRDPNAIDEDGKIAWRNGVPTFTVGVHTGKPVVDLPWKYVDWLLKSDFPREVKNLIIAIRKGQGPSRP